MARATTGVRSDDPATGVGGGHDLVFTSNRGEDTIGIVSPERDQLVATRPARREGPVGIRPNGLAYDPRRRLLVVANVGLTR
jgi:hypothetical protein